MCKILSHQISHWSCKREKKENNEETKKKRMKLGERENKISRWKRNEKESYMSMIKGNKEIIKVSCWHNCKMGVLFKPNSLPLTESNYKHILM